MNHVHHFEFQPSSHLFLLATELNLGLVLLSIIFASIASYSAVIAIDRIKVSKHPRLEKIWLGLGSFVLGYGVWAMHFTGMLAFSLPVQVDYAPLMTLLSVLPAIIASYLVIIILSKHIHSLYWLNLAALILAVGIGLMHYVGMEAMQTSALMVYNVWLFILSIVVAYVLAFIALYIYRYALYRHQLIWQKAIVALLIGFAISGMHYTAMEAANFYTEQPIKGASSLEASYESFIIIGIFLVVGLSVAITIVGAMIDENIREATEHSEDIELREKGILSALADVLLTFDDEGFLLSLNPAGKKLLGVTTVDIDNLHITDVLPDLKLHQLEISDGEGGASSLKETYAYNALGDVLPVEFALSKVNMQSQIIFILVIRDISERKKIEQQLQHAQKLESVGQLASGIAHEINTPTQYILDNVSFLKESFDSFLPLLKRVEHHTQSNSDALIEFDDQIYASAKMADLEFCIEEIPLALDQSIEGLKRVATIIAAMKSFSHPSRGQFERVDIAECIKSTATIARNEWKYVADIQYDIADDLPAIDVIRDEVNQVFLNMIVNAAHSIEERYSESQEKEGIIQFTVYASEESIVIIIADNGKGIARDIQDKIYNPFFTTKEVGRGTGQGLSLSHSVIVEKHQGTIEVQSEEGNGCMFIIKLPIIHWEE